MIPEITPELLEQAKANPGGSVCAMDWIYPGDQFVPPEAIIGAFVVDINGNLTGEYQSSKNYRAIVQASRKPQDYIFRCVEGADHLKESWIVETDPDHHASFPNVPEKWQVGSWYIGADGKITGQFRPNPNYEGPVVT